MQRILAGAQISRIVPVVTAALVASSSNAQRAPLGPIHVSIGEVASEGTPLRSVVELRTEHEYGCSNFRIDARLLQRADTIRIEVRGLVPEQLCDDAFGPAHAYLPLIVAPGSHSVSIVNGAGTAPIMLDASPARLQLRSLGPSATVLADTTPFWRTPPNSLALICGTYNVPELCADISEWLERQRGIRRITFPSAGRLAFVMGTGTHYTDRRYYVFDGTFPMAALRRCVVKVQGRVADAVGVVVIVETASGEVLRASSRRAFHEPHIDTPHHVTDSPAC